MYVMMYGSTNVPLPIEVKAFQDEASAVAAMKASYDKITDYYKAAHSCENVECTCEETKAMMRVYRDYWEWKVFILSPEPAPAA